MKYLLMILLIVLIFFLPESQNCKHDFPGFVLDGDFLTHKADTVHQIDGSVYEIFSVKYLKAFKCWQCRKDTIIPNPPAEVTLLKQADNILFSYRQF